MPGLCLLIYSEIDDLLFGPKVEFMLLKKKKQSSPSKPYMLSVQSLASPSKLYPNFLFIHDKSDIMH